jgi:hypothetical protein
VPVAIGAALVQSSIYDVPGGYRAVLFDRFSGVQQTVRAASSLPDFDSCPTDEFGDPRIRIDTIIGY